MTWRKWSTDFVRVAAPTPDELASLLMWYVGRLQSSPGPVDNQQHEQLEGHTER